MIRLGLFGGYENNYSGLFCIPIKFFTHADSNAKIAFVGISDYISLEMVATFQLHSTFPNFIIIGDTNERV